VPTNLNLQPKGKGKKPYQVAQLLDMIDANGLALEDE
jgi:hypothetical protein